MTSSAIISFLAVFACSLAFTRAIIYASHRFKLLVPVRGDRWHKSSKPYLGGIGIYAAFMVGMLIFESPKNDPDYSLILTAASAIFLLGLIDDLFDLKPYIKFIYQFTIAILVTKLGVVVAVISDPLTAIIISTFWIVAITNAFNLLDNMDGLSGGVAFIGMASFVAIGLIRGDSTFLVTGCVFLAALAGFLVFNFPPAKLFMGDCGALLIGFLLGVYSIKGTWQEASNLFAVLATPVLLLGVPIFDTLVVSIQRTLHGKPIYVGGRDHTSHRLVAHGVSEKKAVLILYTVSILVGASAIAGVFFNVFVTVLGALVVLVAMIALGVFLSDVPVYANESGEQKEPNTEQFTVLIPFFPHKRRLVEILVDMMLVVVAYFTAYYLRFDWQLNEHNWKIIQDSLPILLPVKMLTLLLTGMYGGFWKYIDFTDVRRIFVSTLSASAIAIVVLVGFYRFSGFSRAVFVIDFMVFFLLTTGFRVAIRILRESVYGFAKRGDSVLIVGAGEAGHWVLNEIRKDKQNQMTPVGLIDDDPWKKGRRLYGVQVLGPRSVIGQVVKDHDVSTIIIAIPSLAKNNRDDLVTLALQTGCAVRVLESITSWSDVPRQKLHESDSDSSHTDDNNDRLNQADQDELH